MNHIDMLFRFTCPHCDAVNAPVVENIPLEAAGISTAKCAGCQHVHKIGWSLSVSAEIIDEEIDVEAMIWTDEDDEDEDIADD